MSGMQDLKGDKVSEKQCLSKDEIFKIDDIEIKGIWIEEWKTYVRIKVMTSKERQEFQKDLRGAADTVPPDMMEKLIIMTVVDVRGKLLFEKDDIPFLNKKSSQALGKIFQEAAEINGLTTQSVDNLAKN